MPNDAKLGMVAGVGLVIAVAVFFGHKDASPSSPAVRSVSARASERPGQPPSTQPESPPQPPVGEEKADETASLSGTEPKKPPESDQGR
jgi:hypothetical protein